MADNIDPLTGVIDPLLVGRDLAAATGTPESTWRYWQSVGKGPVSFKIGRRRVYRRSAFIAWLAEQEAAE